MKEIKIGKKGKEKWYPIYAPHIILGTNISILDVNFSTMNIEQKRKAQKKETWIKNVIRIQGLDRKEAEDLYKKLNK